MTSPRRRQDRPVESLALKITFRAGSETTARIKEAIPSARVSDGVCHISLEAKEPAEMAEKARVLLEKLRTVV